MGRRNSTFDDIIFIFAKLPWWLSFGLAIGSYLFLHNVGATEIMRPAGQTMIGPAVTQYIISVGKQQLAFYGQYALPVALIIAGILNLRKRAG